jgi:hypothetical protein
MFLYYWSKKDIKEDIGREIRINKIPWLSGHICCAKFARQWLIADVKLGGVDEKGVPRVVEINSGYSIWPREEQKRQKNINIKI